MSEEQKQTKIRINGKEYILETLPAKIQTLLKYHTIWEAEASKQRLEVAKTEAAIRDIQREINTEITQIEELINGASAAQAEDS